MDLAVLACQTTQALPSREEFGLVSQVRRAAVSIPADMAEGYARTHRRDYMHHLSIAKGPEKGGGIDI